MELGADWGQSGCPVSHSLRDQMPLRHVTPGPWVVFHRSILRPLQMKKALEASPEKTPRGLHAAPFFRHAQVEKKHRNPFLKPKLNSFTLENVCFAAVSILYSPFPAGGGRLGLSGQTSLHEQAVCGSRSRSFLEPKNLQLHFKNL